VEASNSCAGTLIFGSFFFIADEDLVALEVQNVKRMESVVFCVCGTMSGKLRSKICLLLFFE
jgi:hypothetical protein